MASSDWIAVAALVAALGSAGFEFWRWRVDRRDKADELRPRAALQLGLAESVRERGLFVIANVTNTGNVEITNPRVVLVYDVDPGPLPPPGTIKAMKLRGQCEFAAEARGPLSRYCSRAFILSEALCEAIRAEKPTRARIFDCG